MSQTGKIELIIGPMFSGKTTELIRRVERLSYGKKNIISINHQSDIRYNSSNITSHNGSSIDALSCLHLMPIISKFDDFDVIAIDEGQFFDDIVEFSEMMANQGKLVIVAALDGDFKQEPFGQIPQLIPHAEKIDKLTAVCIKCGQDAPFTTRVSHCDNVIKVGGPEMYQSVCRSCLK